VLTGPAGVAGALLGRALGLPLIGSYHTELTAYAQLRSGRKRVAEAMEMAVATFYNACDLVLSPSPASDEALASIGMSAEKVLRWDRGVDTSRFDPALRDEALRTSWAGSTSTYAQSASSREHESGDGVAYDTAGAEGPIYVLYAGRITHEKGADLLAGAFLAARKRDPRLHLVLAGDGPERERLGERVGEHASFLGWQRGADLARIYASADIFLFPSATDTFGQVILEAQASGLPALAVAAGGPLELVQDGVTGLLRDADPGQLADALLTLAGSPTLRKRLAGAALGAVRERTWERALERLATGYRCALDPAAGSSIDATRLVA
jgi:glycosyltransferase involved in cell wall biosynthesis